MVSISHTHTPPPRRSRHIRHTRSPPPPCYRVRAKPCCRKIPHPHAHNLLLELEMTRVDKRKTKCRSGIVMILKSLEKRITKKEQRVKSIEENGGTEVVPL